MSKINNNPPIKDFFVQFRVTKQDYEEMTRIAQIAFANKHFKTASYREGES